jgi:hypothetical protein
MRSIASTTSIFFCLLASELVDGAVIPSNCLLQRYMTCHDGLGSGGTGFQLLALVADVQFTIFDQPGCPMGRETDNFNPDEDQTGTDCKPLAGNPVSAEYMNA